jgi:hypothetical protein
MINLDSDNRDIQSMPSSLPSSRLRIRA